MKQNLPRTYAYLKRFEGDLSKPARGTLRGRALFKLYFKSTDPFYSMYNVSTNTFAPWKVVYKRLSNAFQAAVIAREIIPHEKIILMPTASEEEAHYLCAVLNSSVVNLLLRSSAVRVQTIEYAPGDVEQIAIPDFDPKSRLHCEIATLSSDCHAMAAKGDFDAIIELEERLDNTVIELWGVTASELGLVKQALEDLGPITAAVEPEPTGKES
jgi:hypothetical protein